MQLTKNYEGKNSTYWERVNETSQKVNAWPEWKKNIQIGSGASVEVRAPKATNTRKTD